MNLIRVYLLIAVVAVGMALPAAAQGQDKQATPPLVQLLQFVVTIRRSHALDYTQDESRGSTRTCHKKRWRSSGVGSMHTSRRPNHW